MTAPVLSSHVSGEFLHESQQTWWKTYISNTLYEGVTRFPHFTVAIISLATSLSLHRRSLRPCPAALKSACLDHQARRIIGVAVSKRSCRQACCFRATERDHTAWRRNLEKLAGAIHAASVDLWKLCGVDSVGNPQTTQILFECAIELRRVILTSFSPGAQPGTCWNRNSTGD
jgi:hypothetical protein